MIGGEQDLTGRARRQLEQLFPDGEGVADGARWARGVLEMEGLSTTSVSLRSVRELRTHDPRLSRIAARHLADLATGRTPESPGKHFNPHLE